MRSTAVSVLPGDLRIGRTHSRARSTDRVKPSPDRVAPPLISGEVRADVWIADADGDRASNRCARVATAVSWSDPVTSARRRQPDHRTEIPHIGTAGPSFADDARSASHARRLAWTGQPEVATVFVLKLPPIDRWRCVKSFGARVIGRSMVAREESGRAPTLLRFPAATQPSGQRVSELPPTGGFALRLGRQSDR